MKHSELKKLAAVCRKAGIKSYKCAEFEFTLTDDMPQVIQRKSLEKLTKEESEKEIQSDSLTEEQLLFWSLNDTSVPDNNGAN